MMGIGNRWSRGILVCSTVCLLVLSSGCTTVISSRKMSERNEGPEIKGSEQFELKVGRLQRQALGVEEQVGVNLDECFRNYQVEYWERTWDRVHRKRYIAFAGKDSSYSVGADLFVDPIVGAIVGPLGTLLGTTTIASDGGEMLRRGISGFLIILPFMNVPLSPDFWGENSVNEEFEIEETVDLNERRRRLDPVSKHDVVGDSSIAGMELRWEVLRPDGSRRGRGKIAWPQLIRMPWCKWVLEEPGIEQYFLSVTSDDVELKGPTRTTLSVDLEDAVTRKWPTGSETKSKLSVESVEFFDTKGREITELQTGFGTTMKIRVKNGWGAPTAYSVAPKIEFLSGFAFPVAKAPMIKWLNARSAAELEFAVKIPLETESGELVFDVSVQDLSGHGCAPHRVTIPCQQTDIPRLQVFTATMVPSRDHSSHELRLVIRNRGEGNAQNVLILLDGFPKGLVPKNARSSIDTLGRYSRTSVSIPVAGALPTGLVEIPLEVTLSTDLEMAPVVEKIKVGVVTP